MANSVAETVVGAVVLATAAAFVIYAGQTRGVELAGDSYPLTASFRSAEGITVGTDVRLAGITVGSVTALELDPASYQARATFAVSAQPTRWAAARTDAPMARNGVDTARSMALDVERSREGASPACRDRPGGDAAPRRRDSPGGAALKSAFTDFDFP